MSFLSKGTRVKIVRAWSNYSTYTEMADVMWLKNYNSIFIDKAQISRWLEWTIVWVKHHLTNPDYVYWVTLDNWEDILIWTEWVKKIKTKLLLLKYDDIVIFDINDAHKLRYEVGGSILSWKRINNDVVFKYVTSNKEQLASDSYWYPCGWWMWPMSESGDHKWLTKLVLAISKEIAQWYPDFKLYVNWVDFTYTFNPARNACTSASTVVSKADVVVDNINITKILEWVKVLAKWFDIMSERLAKLEDKLKIKNKRWPIPF